MLDPARLLQRPGLRAPKLLHLHQERLSAVRPRGLEADHQIIFVLRIGQRLHGLHQVKSYKCQLSVAPQDVCQVLHGGDHA